MCQPESKEDGRAHDVFGPTNADEQRFKQIDYRSTEDLSLNDLQADDLPLGLANDHGLVLAEATAALSVNRLFAKPQGGHGLP